MCYVTDIVFILVINFAFSIFCSRASLTKCECGISNKLPVGENRHRIIGGTDYSPFTYPWLTFLQINGTFLCGGSVISDKYILSAAHCWNNRYPQSYLKVVVGIHDRCQANIKSTLLSVNKIIKHRKFNERDFTGDIMLVEMSMKISFSEFVRPICLPSFDITRDAERRYKGKTAIVIGWGKTDQSAKHPSCKPRYLKMPILTKKQCTKDLSYSLFCAGYLNGGKDSCQGDSGGPLQISRRNTNRYEQIGIVSNGIGCALPGNPGLYTDVTRYLPWIYKHIGNSLFCW